MFAFLREILLSNDLFNNSPTILLLNYPNFVKANEISPNVVPFDVTGVVSSPIINLIQCVYSHVAQLICTLFAHINIIQIYL